MVSYELNSYALNNLKGILYKFRFRSGMTSCQSSSVLSHSTMNYRQQPASAPSTSIEAKFGEEKSSAFLCRHRLQGQDWHLVFNDQWSNGQYSSRYSSQFRIQCTVHTGRDRRVQSLWVCWRRSLQTGHAGRHDEITMGRVEQGRLVPLQHIVKWLASTSNVQLVAASLMAALQLKYIKQFAPNVRGDGLKCTSSSLHWTIPSWQKHCCRIMMCVTMDKLREIYCLS